VYFRAKVVKPKGERFALIGAHRINGAPACIKETPAVCTLSDAVTVPKGIEIVLYKIRCGGLKELCYPKYFVRAYVYGSGLSGAACPTALAFKTKTVIKKAGAVEV